MSASAGRLVLGTAQLGMPYGVANRHGQPSAGEAAAILDRALLGGIRHLDTATDYGDAESLIGRYLRGREQNAGVTVVTKLRIEDGSGPAGVCVALAASQRRLGAAPGVALLHDASLLGHWEGPVGDTLRTCRAEGRVGAIGISVYTPEQFEIALELTDINVVQAPFSVLDRRLEQAGLLVRAQARGVRVMLRSVLLQGMLTLERADYPKWLKPIAAPLFLWHELCARHEVAPQIAALRFVIERTEPAMIVVGCESTGQIEELLEAANGPDLPADLVGELEALATSDTRLIDPTNWPL
ncbi:MAG TPA: aldo/keto reductase [Solirubrobacteraceae bacterium]|jgi:aryl-alcohol dehydrogenase-like predicted oxidoreductase|nr:aldo/keto reductase [Solirubrobacteraceae bacterium]